VHYKIKTNNLSYILRKKQAKKIFKINKIIKIELNTFFSMAQQPLVGSGLLIIEASKSHSDTPHSAGLLWTSDQPDAETST
jgi:hypothetical protein